MAGEVNATAAALLGLLRSGPQSGYALARRAADELGEFWSVTRSQVYRELAGMAQRGLVAVGDAGPRERRDYRLTDAGRAAFRDWLHGDLDADVVRIPLLLRLAFADELAPERLAELVAAQRAVHEQRLAGYLDLEAALRAAEVPDAELATLRFGIRYEQAVLRWFAEDLP